ATAAVQAPCQSSVLVSPLASLRMRSFGQLSRNDTSAASASGVASRKSRMWGPALRPATTAFAGAGVGDGTGAWPLGATQLASSESAARPASLRPPRRTRDSAFVGFVEQPVRVGAVHVARESPHVAAFDRIV